MIIQYSLCSIHTVYNGVIHCLLGYLLSFRELPAKVNKAREPFWVKTDDEGEIMRFSMGLRDLDTIRFLILPVAPPFTGLLPGPEITAPSVPQGTRMSVALFSQLRAPLAPVDSPMLSHPDMFTELDYEEDPRIDADEDERCEDEVMEDEEGGGALSSGRLLYC
ncbi:hypothetical protein Tco_1245694 [Tanacetum coccineum]